MEKTITVYNLGSLPTADLDEFLELQEDFKIADPDKNAKLQMLILTRGFKYAFKAWKDCEGKLWIIDAHQRKKALTVLRKSGFLIPPIPYEPIQAATKQEAVEEIAAYNSEFAKKNPDTKLFEKYDISADLLDRFELGFKPVGVDMELDSPISLLSETEAEIIEDDIPNLSNEIISKEGDIWLLNGHRLACGDCTNPKHVNALMHGRRADLVVTDPPYNVNYESKGDEKMSIQNDNMGKDEFYKFLLKVYRHYFGIMKDGAPIYVFHADSEGAAFRTAFTDAGLKFAQCLVWMKNTFTIGRQDYQWQHEPVLYGWKPTSGHTFYGNRKQSTVWQFDKPVRNDIHPTMKPVALVAHPIKNSSKELDLVVDFFNGSGSTLIASEQTNRVCYAMDIDPKYVDVTVKRYIAFNEQCQPVLIRDGARLEGEELKQLLYGRSGNAQQD